MQDEGGVPANGHATKSAGPASRPAWSELFRTMLRIRRVEETALALHGSGDIVGSIHLCIGQEAVPAGAAAALRPGDTMVTTYRGHGWAVAAGASLPGLLAELCGRSSGLNGGRGGSAHLSAPEVGIIGENSIVGAGLPIASGLGMAAQSRGQGAVVVVSFGDGALSQGASHEGLVFAAARGLPVIFICENNGWAEMTPSSAFLRSASLADRVSGYGIPAAMYDGTDPVEVFDATSRAVERARSNGGPSFLEFAVPRIAAHYNGDIEHYRSQRDKQEAVAADPLVRLRTSVVARDEEAAHQFESIAREVEAEVADATAEALAGPLPDVGTARDHVVQRVEPGPPAHAAGTHVQELNYSSAIREALRRELRDRPEVLVYGEDVAVPGGVFGVTRGLAAEFGEHRVFDTPIAESAILGSAVGAAMGGLRPVVEIMWGDFLLVALDQLVNQAANVRYVNQGTQSAPLVVRCQQGATPGSCAQHSQSLEALLAHIPGLRVGVPSNPQDAYAMLRQAVAANDPVILFEARSLYFGQTDTVQLDGVVESEFRARWTRRGSGLSIISWGPMVHKAVAAAEQLQAEGVDAGVLDLRWLSPLDVDAIGEAARVNGRVLVVHEANKTGGFGAEVSATINDRFFHDLDAAPVRLGSPDIRIPASPTLMQSLVPSVQDIVATARKLAED